MAIDREFKIKISWSEEDDAYLARSSNSLLSGLSAFGSTPDEALMEYSAVLKTALHVMESDGEKLWE